MRFPRPLFAAVAALLLAAAGGGALWLSRSPAVASPELATPMLALAHLESAGSPKSLFYSPAAAEFLKPYRQKAGLPALSPAQESERAKEFAKTAQDPKAWRALDRERRFDAVLLTGDPAAFRPLLDHLRQSKDWTLTVLDPTSLVFERSPATAWKPEEIGGLKERFKAHPKAEQVAMRVQMAHRLAAIGGIAPSKALLEEAIALDPHSSPAWTETACNDAAQGRWEAALEAAERAVHEDRHYLPAIAAKANALFALGKFNDALALTRRLVAEAPEDGQNLVLHAKVTHAAHAYPEEIEVLKTILEKSRGTPVGSWRVYLAQAYAADGQAEQSLAEFKAALAEPNLTGPERAFAEKGIQRIQSREPIF